MDFSEFELTDEPVFIQLKHIRTNQPLFEQRQDKGEDVDDLDKPVGVKIYGADSDVFKKHLRRVANRGLEARFNRSGGNAKSPISAEELDDETQKTMAACIAEFVNVSWKGKALKAPEDNLMFVKRLPWAIEQIDRAMADRTLFMPALKKT